MTQHTPGPWHCSRLYDERDGWPRFVRHTQADGTTPNIADLDCFGGPADEGRANARLIKLAPEMLEALEDVLASNAVSYTTMPDRHDRIQRLIREAREAVR